MSAHCGWHMSHARHTLSQHRSECEFYLEHFVVQLYLYVVCILLYSCIYVVCILCIYTLVYFLFMSFAHSRQFLHLYLSISVRIVYSFVYFLHGKFYLSVLLYLTLLFCNLYFIKCPFINMVFHADLCLFFTLLYACLACL